jgi:hypothetical protein
VVYGVDWLGGGLVELHCESSEVAIEALTFRRYHLSEE